MSFKRQGRASAAPGLRPLLIAAALACGAAGASAQSLSAIYEAARGYDPTYLGAKATAEAAQYSLEEVKALNRPGVAATVQAGDQRTNFPHAVPTSEDNKSLSGTISAQLSLFNRQNDVLIDQSRRQFEASKAALVIADEDLIVRVASAYFDVLSSAEALQTVLANKRAIGEQLASAKRNFDVGNATITDTREAQARFDLTIAQEVVARNDLQVKRVTLDQIVGRAGVIPQALPATVTLPPVLPSQAEDWVRLAQTESPALKQARLAFEVAQLETDKAKAGHLPTLAVQASYNRTRINSDVSQVSNGGTGTTGQMALVLNVPLFSGFSVQNRVKETLLLQEKARNDVDAATNGTTLGTRTAFLGAQAQAAQVRALEAAESSSRLALESTQLGYKVGVRVNLDVLNAQSQLSNTERDLAKARYDYLLATLRLRQAAGTLTPNDLLPINAMLTVPLAADPAPATPAAQPVTSTAPKP